ncbi:hypothetical protein [Acidithiobacillus ferrooxidans]|uniref:hypothetical protein n=1 Tax=Acidithiobacillus ferrooxidans TaxID=920 RepID=UPI0021F8E978|nr:hypothetical protein [Acidithiobacillus ferrooxidans]
MSEYNGCELPEDLFYDLDYVWVRPEDDGTLTIGVTDPAQTMSGRLQKARIKKGRNTSGGRTACGYAGKRQMGRRCTRSLRR